MNQFALGLIETIGYTTAVSAADAALKTANVSLVGVEKVIGVGGALGVTIHLSGDVGAVQSAVEAGKQEAEKVGRVISAHVIPRTHIEVNEKLLPFFALSGNPPEKQERVSESSNSKKEFKQRVKKVNTPKSNMDDEADSVDQQNHSNEEQ